MAAQLKEMCAILSGLVVANDYSKGQILLKDREFKDNFQFFQKVFEIGRRYKVIHFLPIPLHSSNPLISIDHESGENERRVWQACLHVARLDVAARPRALAIQVCS